MVTLTFIFDQEKIAKAGYSEEELLQPVRDHAKKYNITEVEHGVFAKDGEDALCTVSMAIPLYTDTFPEYDTLLNEWTLDVDGEKEDCIQETREWFADHGKKTVYSMESEKIIQPLTPEIVEEADKESVREMDYVKEHMEELKNMTWEERWKVLGKVRKYNKNVLQPLTPEIMEEADEETSRQMEYYSTHKEELRNMTEEEFFRTMMKAAKE